MKKFSKSSLQLLILILLVSAISSSCKSGGEGKSSKSRKQDRVTLLTSNVDGTGGSLEIEMLKGKSHNHPSFAIWIEDTNGKYLQTLFVTRALGRGIYEHGDNSGGTWKPGEVRRPAALPYWFHKRSIVNEFGSFEPTPKNRVPDAYTGATPAGGFRLNTRTDLAIKGRVKVLLEINQPWDWNEYWNNSLYPDDSDYKTSCQPAIVYSAIVDMNSPGTKVELKPVGHSHYSGKNGELFTDLSTVTTALHIAEQISAVVK